eukprot:CAMPEP_0202847646 /NCGR_PEP_ID=MMETSP1389-20130828/75980_1 /ASSEMBLY_ACC=CAM_ASM_000865 /TAXON_ID=302021 /ORGANISM="Rhodomonas sp., Strain CCMP768" /LENGTH=55 /DNA_ID=CAMNT_0049525387 /DNA_START=121 /DNA_END=284 /DNA_ORIENTATION=+
MGARWLPATEYYQQGTPSRSSIESGSSTLPVLVTARPEVQLREPERAKGETAAEE